MLTRSFIENLYRQYCVGDEARLYVLADHSGIPNLSRALRNNKIEWTNLLGNEKRPELVYASPLLFELTFSGGGVDKGPALVWLNENASATSSVMLITSPLNLVQLGRRLAERCDGVLSEGAEIVIRFFDTRVFPNLLDVLTQEQRSIWLGIATNWWYQDRTEGVIQIESTYRDNDEYCEPLTIDDIQLAQLMNASESDQVAFLLERNLPGQYNALSNTERFAFIDKHIRAAASLGITETADFALYCALALLYEETQESAVAWERLRSRVMKNEVTLRQAAKELEGELG